MAKSHGRSAHRVGHKKAKRTAAQAARTRSEPTQEQSLWDRKRGKSALAWMTILGTALALLGFFVLPPNPKVTITDTRVASFFDTYVHIENSGIVPMVDTKTFVNVQEYRWGDPRHPNSASQDLSDNQPAPYRVSMFGDGYDLPLRKIVDLPAGQTLSARIRIITVYHWPYLSVWRKEKDTDFVGFANRDGTWSWTKPGSTR